VTRYVTVRLTREQAQAASNACDLIRDQLEADDQRREAALYQRACVALDQVIKVQKTAPIKGNRK